MKPIVFTQLKPSFWQFKTALALKNKGFKPILVCLLEKFDKKEYSKAFDEIICPGLTSLKPWRVLEHLIKHPIKSISFLRFMFLFPEIVIAEAPPHYLSAFFIWWFKYKCPRIYFPYDMISSRYKTPEKYLAKRELWGEKYAFKNCNAILYKSADYEFKLLPEDIQASIKNKPKFGFPSYTQSELFTISDIRDKLSYKDKEIHLVNAGTFTEGSPLYRSMYEYFYNILKQGFHLHLYSPDGAISETHKRNITKDEQELAGRLHIHPFSPVDKFSEELSKYDYGINMIYFSDIAKEGAKEIAATNKLASYLEAGLPILVNKQLKYFADLVQKNKIGLVIEDWNLSDLKSKIKKENYAQLVRNVIKFRDKYSMENNINKFIKFINKLSK